MVELLPDAVELLRQAIIGNASLQTIVGERVSTQVDAQLPAIRLQRLGSPPFAYWEDRPEIQVDCLADDQDTASVLARTFVAALEDMIGDYTEGAIRGCEVSLGPMWAPDEIGEPRYIIDVRLLTYT